MPSSDQDVFDISYVLDSIDTFTESVENHFENVARSLQDAFRETPWLPDSVKPRSTPTTRQAAVVRPPVGYFETARKWVSEHRAVTAAVVAFIGTGVFIIWRKRRAQRTKRRAKRAKTGARTEVIILSGAPISPLTRSLSLDLERRGFIIYVPVNTLSEEQMIQGLSRPDIRPLSLDITSPTSVEQTLQKLHNFLNTPQHAIANAPSHAPNLTALIHVPSSSHQRQSLSTTSPAVWSDVLNTELLAPFTTISAFLPLLIAQSSTLVFLTPSIVSSLAPAGHATESVVAGGMNQYIKTLRHEVAAQGLIVSELKLGHFDLLDKASNPGEVVPVRFHHPSRAELTKQRLQHAARGTPIKRLHNAIFDIVERRQGCGGTTFVGRGARTYDLVGRWMPSGILGWILGNSGTPVAEGKGVEAGVKDGSEGSVEWEKVDDSSSS